MDAQKFLAEFEHIANAPGGVARLKELVLALATTGQLVPKRHERKLIRDELRQLSFRKSELIKQKIIPRQAPLPDIAGDYQPFKLPDHWSFVRLGELTIKIGSGSTPRGGRSAYASHGVPFLRSQNIWDDGIRMNDSAFISIGQHTKMSGTAVHAKDLLLNITGASLGRCALVPDIFNEANVSQHVSIIRLLEPQMRHYMHLCIRSPIVQSMIWGRQIGMAREGLSKQTLELFEIPLPPENERNQIVEKVDELMALCDKLDVQQQVRRKLQNSLRQSILQAVANATSPHELQYSWVRFAENFGRLFSAPEDVLELRALFLGLAARGLLSEPEIEDENPVKLLENMRAQQKEQFNSKEFREIEALPKPTYVKRRLLLSLGNVARIISGQHLKPEKYNKRKEGIPYITGPAEFRAGRPFPSKWTFERQAIAQLHDILITVKGSGVGKTAHCDLKELAISRQLMAIRPLDGVSGEYLSICVTAAENKFQQQKFGIAIPGIGRQEVLSLEIMLPSLEEQSRIVSRVWELLSFSDALKSQLLHTNDISRLLAEAAISNLTGIAIEREKDKPMKAPQTELIAPLRSGATPNIKAQAPLATILARNSGELSAKDLWQRFGGEIDVFYGQLKIEVAHGWILEPALAKVREIHADTAST